MWVAIAFVTRYGRMHLNMHLHNKPMSFARSEPPPPGISLCQIYRKSNSGDLGWVCKLSPNTSHVNLTAKKHQNPKGGSKSQKTTEKHIVSLFNSKIKNKCTKSGRHHLRDRMGIQGRCRAAWIRVPWADEVLCWALPTSRPKTRHKNFARMDPLQKIAPRAFRLLNLQLFTKTQQNAKK